MEAGAPRDSVTELYGAIQRLYSTFVNYKPAQVITGCPHCTSIADDRLLRQRPLARLTAGEMERFARKAVTTLGTVNDLKHFLPRLLELAATQGDVGNTDIEIVFGKLAYAEWEDWPSDERSTIAAYLAAFWRDTLSRYPSVCEVDQVLCAIGAVATNMTPYLAEWRSDKGLPALRHLAEFAKLNSRPMSRKQALWNACWDARPQQMQQVLSWLLGAETRVQLEQGFFEYLNHAAAAELSEAIQYLGG